MTHLKGSPMPRPHNIPAALLLLLLLLFCSTLSVSAEEMKTHITILAVVIGDDGNLTGSPADLSVEIQPGEGRVFMDTYPLQKIDTQISTRVAKDIACSFLKRDCSSYDFIYTIRAQSSMVSGPSASGAIAAVTAALLDGLHVDESVSMTGTINSGGIIGGVDGIKEKIDAAAERNIRTVLIPYGMNTSFINNQTVSLYDYAAQRGIMLKEISTLREALYYFTGKTYPAPEGEILLDDHYVQTMRSVASRLCDRNNDILARVPDTTNLSSTDAFNLSQKAQEAFSEQHYYSAASYCYGVNTIYRYSQFRDLPIIRAYSEINALTEQIQSMSNYSYDTVSNLQTSMVVNERLTEAEDYLKAAIRTINDTELRNSNIAFAKERVYSAEAWSAFFDNTSSTYTINAAALQESCLNKYAETEEWFNYLAIINPALVVDVAPDLQQAASLKDRGDYVLCLFESAKTQAKINLLYESLMMKPENLPQVIGQKTALVKEIILNQQSKGIFPFLGYSYYEYALSLKDDDPYSALLYLQYAQQFSDLDIYFKDLQPRKQQLSLPLQQSKAFAFAEGILAGIIIAYLVLEVAVRRKR